jgi:hypothetical protein
VAKARLIFTTFRERVRCAPLASLGSWCSGLGSIAKTPRLHFRCRSRNDVGLFNRAPLLL